MMCSHERLIKFRHRQSFTSVSNFVKRLQKTHVQVPGLGASRCLSSELSPLMHLLEIHVLPKIAKIVTVHVLCSCTEKMCCIWNTLNSANFHKLCKNLLLENLFFNVILHKCLVGKFINLSVK